MRTVDDLINTLERYKKEYPEFGKYNICIDVSGEDDIIPRLTDVAMYINTDIGQVEFFGECDDWD